MRVRFTELMPRLTGVSTPVFGVQRTPPEAEVGLAQDVLTFLEDRRVLYAPSFLEVPLHVSDSVHEMRRFLTAAIRGHDVTPELEASLRALRAACSRFLGELAEIEQRPTLPAGMYGMPDLRNRDSFYEALGALRATVGIHVARIAVLNGLDVGSDLACILPSADDE
jgi:hypothetical protein